MVPPKGPLQYAAAYDPAEGPDDANARLIAAAPDFLARARQQAAEIEELRAYVELLEASMPEAHVRSVKARLRAALTSHDEDVAEGDVRVVE